MRRVRERRGTIVRIGDQYSSPEIEIKKGPWKAEEDEVLICHVSKYGPRDWSSIRSRGLLQRTGKSCRLRWVNKLRPNLKNGMKFSAEEERIVIELQGQFGNRWARIATHLPGRTDNDVKNFWSSRQKRLARLLQNPTPPPFPKSSQQNRNRIRNRNNQVPSFPYHDGLTHSKVYKLSSPADEESSSSLTDNNSSFVQRLHFTGHVLNPTPISAVRNLFEPEFDPVEKNPTHDSNPFPPIPDLLPEYQPKEEFDILPAFFDVFGNVGASGYGGDDMAQFPFLPTVKNETPDIIFDELPLDMFDHIEPLQSPRHCSNI